MTRKALTIHEVLADVADDYKPAAWYHAGGLWVRLPHDATDDDIKAAMNELHRHLCKTRTQRREAAAS